MTRGDVVYINLPLVAGAGFKAGGDQHTSNGRQHTIRQSNDDDCANDHYASNGAISIHTSDRAFSQNGLSAPSIALVFQLCATDRTHLDAVIGHLEDHYLVKIDEMMRKMLSL